MTTQIESLNKQIELLNERIDLLQTLLNIQSLSDSNVLKGTLTMYKEDIKYAKSKLDDLTNFIEYNFPTQAYERFAAKSRLHVKKKASKLNISFDDKDIELVNNASLLIFTELLEEQRESEKLFVIDEFELNRALDGVWFVWNIEKKASCQ